MHRTQILFSGAALCATSLVLGVVPQAVATASLPTVTVRVEGSAKTLLAAKTVTVRSGSITKYGAPAGVCPADSGQGALDVATKGNWGGSFSQQYQEYFITKILGESAGGTKTYWTVLVNHKTAMTGGCEIKLHRGDDLVFAVIPATGTTLPIGITAPAAASVGHPFTARIVAYDAKGKARPLAGATVRLGRETATSNASGVVRLTPRHAGRLVLRASEHGYIRDEAKVNAGVSAVRG